MTGEDVRRLERAVRRLKGEIRKHPDLNEANTRRRLIEPLLKALGWRADDIDSEFKKADYALRIQGVPRVFIEAKALRRPKLVGVSQGLGRASEYGIEWCLLTNGDVYRLYNVTVPGPAETKLLFEADVSQATEHDLEHLALLSRASVENNHLARVSAPYFQDRRVVDALHQASPDGEVAQAICRTLCDLAPEKVVESLRRLHVRIQPTPVVPPPKPNGGQRLSAADAAAKVLGEAGGPLDCKTIFERSSAKGYWTSSAPTPAATIYSAIFREIEKKGDRARFRKAEPGKFTLNR